MLLAAGALATSPTFSGVVVVVVVVVVPGVVVVAVL